MKIPLGGSWFFDFGKWAWGLGSGALSGAAGVVVLTPAIASIDPEHFNAFAPGPNTLKLMLYLFGYGMIKNGLQYMASNPVPSPFKDVRTTVLEPTQAGGVKLTQEAHQESIPAPKEK